MEKEEGLRADIDAYFNEQKEERKKAENLKARVKTLVDEYQAQYGGTSSQPSVTTYEQEIAKLMTSTGSIFLHPEFFVSIVIGKHIFDGLQPHQQESLSSKASQLASSATNKVYTTKTGEKFMQKYEYYPRLSDPTRGRHFSIASVLEYFSFNTDNLLVLTKVSVADEEHSPPGDEDGLEIRPQQQGLKRRR